MADSRRTPLLGVRIGSAELLLRPAVALRECPLADGVGFYLSLYDDEIDDRADAFWSRWARRSSDAVEIPLELTDAALHVGRDGRTLVVRGGAATFPLYWSVDGGRVRISTALPVRDGEAFSRTGLAAAAAAACVAASYEPNGVLETPLARWRRVRRASLACFDGRGMRNERAIHAVPPMPDVPREAIVRDVRGAFDAYTRSQGRIRSSVLELSGGIDSTLAAAIPSRAGMRGVSVTFPYYEFRFERAVQQATAEFLGVPRAEIDGLDVHPYAPPDAPPRFDEPTVFVTGIRHAEQVARFAVEDGARRIYTGHGGDQCFATDLLTREPLVPNPPGRGPFSRVAWRSVARAMDEVRRSPWTERRLGTFIHDARPDVWVKETFGPTMRTPFADLGVFRSALAWSRWCRARGRRPDKTILGEAAHDLLPEAVLMRPGKVAYDGVWMRAYLRHAGHIAGCFERTADILTHVGISPGWLQRRVLDLAAWRRKSDREVLAVYAIAAWLLAWDIRRAGDVRWAD